MPPELRARIEASRPQLIKSARDEYGVDLHIGPFGINSRLALVAHKYAEAQGKGEAFHKAVMQAYWQQAKSIDDKSVLLDIAAQVGLPIDQFEEALSNPVFEDEVTADIDQAYEYGINAVPSMVFNNKYLLSGALPYSQLKQVVEQIQQKEGAA